MTRSRRPAGLELCRPELVSEALAVADRLGIIGERPVELLRVVDAGAAIIVVNRSTLPAPAPPEYRPRRRPVRPPTVVTVPTGGLT